MSAHLARFVLAGLLAGCALAQDDVPANTTGPVLVGGFQDVLCAAGFAEESVPVDLTATPSQSVQVSIECNAPFALEANAAYGELRNADEYQAGDQLTFVPYIVIWPSLLNFEGAAIGASFSATGAAWAEGLRAESQATSLRQVGSMTVQWGPPPEVIAGAYNDTFELNIIAN